MIKTINKTITISIISSSLLLGVETPNVNISDAIKQAQPPKIERPTADIPHIKSEDESLIPKELQDGKKIFVKKFEIIGAKNLSNDEFLAIVAPYENRELSFYDMQEVASLITKAYRFKGYFVSRAYIPKQKLLEQDGTLKLEVIEGNYGEFHLTNNSLIKDSFVQAMLDDIKDKNIVSTNTLERVMLIINDSPGAVVTKADVKPGTKVGTSDFEIETQPTKRYEGYLIGDNEGSRYTGKNRAMAGVSINSPFAMGDKISLSGMLSNDSALTNYKAGYGFAILPNGTRGELSYSKTTYTLGDVYESLDAQGISNSLDFTLSYPIIRTRVETLKSFITLSSKDMKDDIKSTNDTTKKDATVVVAGLEYDKSSIFFGKDSQTLASLSLSAGDLKFEDMADKISDRTGANTQGNYEKINFSLAKNITLDEMFTLNNSLRGQYALSNKNLDGTEDMSIGGAYGVKLFPDGESSAENGYIFNTELLYNLPTTFSSKVSIFYDAARVHMSDNSVVNFESRTLQDVGVGYYVNYQEYFLKAQYANKIGNNKVQSEPEYANRFLLQAGLVF